MIWERLPIYWQAIKDIGTGGTVAEYGKTNADWVELSNGNRVKVVKHVESEVIGPSHVSSGGAVVDAIIPGRGEVKGFKLDERESNGYLGLRHDGDDYETI